MNIGILGGGQLARMMILAGVPLGQRFHVLDPAADACAGQVAPLFQGAYDDNGVLSRFAEAIDLATFDFENVPAASAQWLAACVPVYPRPNVLAVAQDRLYEKALFQELEIPVPEFADIRSLDEMNAAVQRMGGPCVLKTRRLGYDGKGQFRIRNSADVLAAWQALGNQAATTGLILESFVHFQREISLVGVRSREGEFRCWPLSENWHVDGVLSASLACIEIERAIEEMAFEYAQRLAERLDYVGTFALELFEQQGALLANEMAPRVHNSGHWTIEGAETSQFENHLRAISGLPLGSTRPLGWACMLNWIGTMPASEALLVQEGVHWHDYGKSPRAGRKVGHATLRADSKAELIGQLTDVGQISGRIDQVTPVIDRLRNGH